MELQDVYKAVMNSGEFRADESCKDKIICRTDEPQRSQKRWCNVPGENATHESHDTKEQ